VSKLSDAEMEAAETQTWIRFARACGYWTAAVEAELYQTYDYILGKLVKMIANPSPWLLVNRAEGQRSLSPSLLCTLAPPFPCSFAHSYRSASSGFRFDAHQAGYSPASTPSAKATTPTCTNNSTE